MLYSSAGAYPTMDLEENDHSEILTYREGKEGKKGSVKKSV